MGGAHHHGHADGSDVATADRARERGLRLAIFLTLGFAAVEAVAGWWAGSLALMADAGHMVTDSFALLLAWLAASLSQRPPGPRLSYGWRRAEVFAAVINALLMLAVVALLVPAALRRLQSPTEVQGAGVLLVAAVGLIVNLVVLRILRGADRGALNTRGALLHVIGDLLGSVAALVAGGVILLTGWMPIDPLLSLLIAALILVSALRLVRDALHVLMEAVPKGIDLDGIRTHLLALPGITAVHDLHVWTLAGDRLLLSAHVGVERIGDWAQVLAECQHSLRQHFGIGHATLQPEPPEYARLVEDPACDAPLDDHAH
jgi:cobalt-zinc-cadmium efflux system protein